MEVCPLVPAPSLDQLQEVYDTLKSSVNQVHTLLSECRKKDLLKDEGDVLPVMFKGLLPTTKEAQAVLSQQENILFHDLPQEACISKDEMLSLILKGEGFIQDFQSKVASIRKLAPKSKAKAGPTPKVKSELRPKSKLPKAESVEMF